MHALGASLPANFECRFLYKRKNPAMGLGDAWVFGSALTDDASELDHPFIMNLTLPSVLRCTARCGHRWNELTATAAVARHRAQHTLQRPQQT